MYRQLAQITLILVFFTVSGSIFAAERDINENFNVKNGTLDINIDIIAAELTIIPSGKKSEINVTAEYDDKYCEIGIEFSKNAKTLNIRDKYEPVPRHDRDRHTEGVKITVKLPYDPEIDLNVECIAGGIDIQLGGLSLKNVDIELIAGDLTIDFDKPNRITLGTFDIDCKAGNLNLKNLGNAHFSDARINNNAGNMSVDFSGDIRDDASADIDINVGEMDITIPKKLGTKMNISQVTFFNPEKNYKNFDKKGSNYYSDNYGNSDNLLSLDISSTLGDVDVRMK
jgi:hypothetical protein